MSQSKELLQNKKKYMNWADHTLQWVLYLSVVIIPLIFLPYLNSVFTFPKIYVFRILTIIVIGIWGARMLFYKKVDYRFTKFIWFALAYAIICGLNTIYTVNLWTSLFGTYGRFTGLLTILNLIFWMYILINELNTREKIIKLLWYSVVTAFVVALYGILQYWGVSFGDYTWTQDATVRMFSTVGHSNHVAAYLGMNIMIAIGLFAARKFDWHKIALTCMIFIMLIAVIFTASRGGILAIAAAGIVWFIFSLKQKKFVETVKTYGKVVLFLFTVLILFVAVFRQPIKNLEVVQRTQYTIERIAEGNFPDRISWWFSSIEMVKDNPILGHGLSVYRDIYNQYRRIDYRIEEDKQDHITPESAHMEYFTILAQQGILGLLVYLAMVISALVYGFKYIAHSRSSKNQAIVSSLIAAIFVYLFQVLVNFGVVTTLFMFYTFMALIVAYTMNNGEQPREIKANIFVRIVLWAFAFGVVIMFGVHTFAHLAAEFSFKQAGVHTANADFEKAVKSYENAIGLMPYIEEYHEGYGDFLFNLGMKMPLYSQKIYLMDALHTYDNAIDVNPNYPYVHLNKAMVASKLTTLELVSDDEAQRYAKIALDEHKWTAENVQNNPVFPYKYAKALMFFGEKEEALIQFKRVLEIRNPYFDSQEMIDQLSE
jgi:O-antigen ligase